MPMYDYACEVTDEELDLCIEMTVDLPSHCGWSDTLMCSTEDRDNQVCPVCGAFLVRAKAYPSTRLVGATDTNPSDYGNGLKFTSPAAEKAYFKEHPAEKPVSKTDSLFKNKMGRITDIREKKAVKMGFRNLNDQQQNWKQGVTQK